MLNLGDFPVSAVIDFMWNTNGQDGASITRGTNGSIRIYKDNSATQRTSSNGITDTEDFDSLTGIHHLRIDTSDNSDSGFYAAGHTYHVVLQGAVIDTKTVNACIAVFTIESTNIGAISAKIGTPIDQGSGADLSNMINDWFNFLEGIVSTINTNVGSVLSTTNTMSNIVNRLAGLIQNFSTVNAGSTTTAIVMNTLAYPNDEINGYLLVIKDSSGNSRLHSRWIEDWDLATTTATLDTPLPFTPEINVDTWYLFAIRREGSVAALTSARSELSAVPAANAGIADMMKFMFMKVRNEETATASEATIKKDDGTTIGTSALDNDGTTFTKGKMS